MVEALIVVPVLCSLLFAAPLLHERYAAKQQALLLARAAAWAHVWTGCASAPAAGVDLQPAGAPAAGPETDVVAMARRTARAAGGVDVFAELPLIADALGALLGELVRVRAEVAMRPRAGVTQRIGGDLVLLCNERPRDVLEIAGRVFCERVPGICGGGS